MKKLFTIITATILFLAIIGKVVYSQTPASSSATDEAFKDKVASAAARYYNNNDKAVSGFITGISGNTITINTTDDQTYEIKLDDILTKYYRVVGNGRKEIKLSDLQKGDYAIAAGVINDKSVNANFIYIDESFLVRIGKISQVNSDNYTLTVVTTDKDTYTLNIEATTKQQIINIKTLAVEKGGFSKIKVGDTIHFVAQRSGQEKNNTYSALKILILPQEYFLQ